MAKLNIKKDKTRGWTIEKFMPESTIIASSNGTHPMDISSNLDAISEDQEADLTTGSNSSSSFSSNNNNRNNNNNNTSNNNNNNNNSNFRQSHSHSDNSNSSEDDNHSDDDHDMEGVSSSKRDRRQHTTTNSNDDEDDDEDDDQEESEHSTTDESEEEPDHQQNGRLDIPKSKNNPRLKKKRASSLSTSPSDPSRVVSATPTKKITKKSKKSVKSKSSKGNLSSSRQPEEAKLEAAKPIVSRFLEMENTKLNDKLLQVFMISGMCTFGQLTLVFFCMWI